MEYFEVTSVIDTLFTDVTESLFVSAKLGKQDICVGEMYQIPNTSLDLFNVDYKRILDCTKCFKTVVIGMDHNLDLIKGTSHKETCLFVETFGLAGFVSTINKPTRITHQSSTLIDNINGKR